MFVDWCVDFIDQQLRCVDVLVYRNANIYDRF